MKEVAYGLLFPIIIALSLSISAFEILSSIFVILSIFSFVKNGERSLVKDRWIIFLMIYLLVNAVSWAASSYFYDSFRGFFRVSRHILFCFSLAYVIDSERKLSFIIKAILLWAVAVSFDAIVQGMTGVEYLLGRPLTHYLPNRAFRVTGPYQHANDFSAYLCLVFFIYWGFLKEGWKAFRPFEKPMFSIGFLLILSSIICTYSRGAWLAVSVTFVAWAVLRRSKEMLIFLMLFGVWGALFSPETVKIRFQSLGEWGDGTMTERRILWGEAVGMIKDRPFFGFGPKTYSKIEPQYKPADSKTDYQYAHNGYLQIAAETGLFGLLSFLSAIFYAWLSSYRAIIHTRHLQIRTIGLSLLFGILAFLIHAATDTDLQSILLVNQFWLAMGMLWAAKRLSST